MKKSKILCLVICVLSLISIIGFAAENTYYYYKDGEKKFFTVSANIDGRHTTHQITGDDYSYPSGNATVSYHLHGVVKVDKIYGTSYRSYWYTSYNAPADVFRATTTVTTIINRTVTAIK